MTEKGEDTHTQIHSRWEQGEGGGNLSHLSLAQKIEKKKQIPLHRDAERKRATRLTIVWDFVCVGRIASEVCPGRGEEGMDAVSETIADQDRTFAGI